MKVTQSAMILHGNAACLFRRACRRFALSDRNAACSAARFSACSSSTTNSVLQKRQRHTFCATKSAPDVAPQLGHLTSNSFIGGLPFDAERRLQGGSSHDTPAVLDVPAQG